MKKFRTRGTGRKVADVLATLLLVVGLGLVGYSFWGGGAVSASGVGTVSGGLIGAPEKPSAPKETSMTLTVPKMARVDGVPVYTAPASDKGTLDRGALHVKGTGFPWQKEANVYIAGHRLGYPNTDSFLAFFDLNKLENGDKVFVTDASGTRYTYEVFKEFVVSPSNISVTEPIPGKNILTLQTCTLPDYSRRLIVQAELVEVA